MKKNVILFGKMNQLQNIHSFFEYHYNIVELPEKNMSENVS